MKCWTPESGTNIGPANTPRFKGRRPTCSFPALPGKPWSSGARALLEMLLAPNGFAEDSTNKEKPWDCSELSTGW